VKANKSKVDKGKGKATQQDDKDDGEKDEEEDTDDGDNKDEDDGKDEEDENEKQNDHIDDAADKGEGQMIYRRTRSRSRATQEEAKLAQKKLEGVASRSIKKIKSGPIRISKATQKVIIDLTGDVCLSTCLTLSYSNLNHPGT
jgi:hypothetical protein